MAAGEGAGPERGDKPRGDEGLVTARGPRSGQGGTSGAAPELEGVGGVPRVWGQATRPGGTLRTGWHRPPAGHRGSARHGGTGRVLRGEGAAGGAGARLAVGPGVSRRSSPGLCWVRTSRGPDALCLGWRLRLRHRDGAGVGVTGGPAAPGLGWGLRGWVRGVMAPRWGRGSRGPRCRDGGSGGCSGRRGWGGRGTRTGLGARSGGHGTTMRLWGAGVRAARAPRRGCPRPGSLPAGAEHYGVGTGARGRARAACDCPQG